jgi:DNA excision repair protein ERCC-2
LKETHSIAVRTLVDAVLRSGDLSMRFAAPGRTLEGIRIHQKIQRQRPEGYRAEVPVSVELETETLLLVIGGRIDGVLKMDGQTIVEEIKSTARDLDAVIERPNACHWGQARVYGYLLAREEKLTEVTVRLIYCHVETEETREHSQTFTMKELERFFEELVDRYLVWAQTLAGWRQQRDASIDAVEFPFSSYRRGQRSLAVMVYRTIRDSGQALVQASTGIGKSMAVLFPAVKSIGAGQIDRIFFLTARNTGKEAAIQALNILQGKGLYLKRVCLTAKDKTCFCPEAACSPDACTYAKGHFDRLNAALQAAFETDNLDRGAIETVARIHRVCPFEFSLELSLWADCIICDYNYAFDPRVHLRRFFEDENGAYAFLVDEAHNLVDRSREMFSARLYKSAFLELRREVKAHLPGLYRTAGKINTWMLAARKRTEAAGGFQSDAAPPEGLEPLLQNFLRTAERWLAKNRPANYRDLVLENYFTVNAFMRIRERFDKSYVSCYETDGKQLAVKLFCLDPSGHLKEAMQRCRAAVFFSGTLTPADYFQTLFGCDADAARLAIASPFPRRHLQVLVADNISTYYNQREKSAVSIAELIRNFIGRKKGNYLCFFPSYAYLSLVAEKFEAIEKEAKILVQSREMDDAQRTRFLDHFLSGQESSLVGFAVMGGIFGEGIDLVGERLCGAVIVGVGLPAICPERDLIRGYFDEQGIGFDFAYRFPGINRVLQAAGRVIRSGRDRGALLLVDQRFGSPGYRKLLPDHWSPLRVHSSRQVKTFLDRFWEDADQQIGV